MPIPFSKIRFENLEKILKVIEAAFSKRDMDFYLIGALARDIQLTGKYDIEAPRATQDIDIAVLVNNQENYSRIVDDLIGQYGFEKTNLPYRFRFTDDTVIDVLPFGKIESAERTVILKGERVEELSVIGFQENREFTEEIEFENGLKIRVSSLGGICLLKFFAWADKPYDRKRDISDINFILSKYTEIFIDEIFKQHSDLLDLDLDWNINLAPRLLGRHIALILKDKNDTKNRLITLLNEQLTDESMLALLLTNFNNRTIADNIYSIQEIINGVNE